MKALGSIAVMAGLGKPESKDGQNDGYEALIEALERDKAHEKGK